MESSENAPWKPLSLANTIEIFRGAAFRWWISGGLALELHLLDGWDIHVAAAGQLKPWTGQELLSGVR